jgi:hypothetical protein
MVQPLHLKADLGKIRSTKGYAGSASRYLSMPGIFISYRREDSIGHTGRLYDLLAKHFGKAHVFMDIDTIGPGEDFLEVIEKTCESCQVLLAIIGRSWTRVTDQEGNRRLDNPSDFVRLEIAHALEKKILVVPVLEDSLEGDPWETGRLLIYVLRFPVTPIHYATTSHNEGSKGAAAT